MHLAGASRELVTDNYKALSRAARHSTLGNRFTNAATVALVGNWGGHAVTVKITSASEINAVSPTNLLILPEDAEGDYNVVIDASKDLKSWMPFFSQTVSSATAKKPRQAHLLHRLRRRPVHLPGHVIPLRVGVDSELDRFKGFIRIGFRICVHGSSGWRVPSPPDNPMPSISNSPTSPLWPEVQRVAKSIGQLIDRVRQSVDFHRALRQISGAW